MTTAAAAPPDAQTSNPEAPPEQINMTEEEEYAAAGDAEGQTDSGKLKTLLGILKRMVGVKDMAAIRLSLPANLLEPVPNLEYWNYLDRADILSTVGDYEDPLDRMLMTLRFTFTKELKFVHGKVCKPYNSILGEHFRAHWDVTLPKETSSGELIPVQNVLTSQPSVMQTCKSGDGFTPVRSIPSRSSAKGNNRRKENATTPIPSREEKEQVVSRPSSVKASSMNTVSAGSGSEKDSGRTDTTNNTVSEDSKNNSTSTSPSTAPSTGTVNPVSPLLAPTVNVDKPSEETGEKEKESFKDTIKGKAKGKGKNKESLTPANSRPSSIRGVSSESTNTTPSRPSSMKRGLSKILGRRNGSSNTVSSTTSPTSQDPISPASNATDDSNFKNPTHLSIPPSAVSSNSDGGSNRSTSNEGAIDEDKEKETPQVNGYGKDSEDQDGNADADTISLNGSFKTSLTTGEENEDTSKSNSVSNQPPGLKKGQRRITFICEQVSHHPPISSFFCECKESGVQLCGVDQLSAKFTGTNIKIFSGDQNQGIFLRLTNQSKCGLAGEEYQITHPTASINGMFRGSLWVAISDTLYVTCRGGRRDNEEPRSKDQIGEQGLRESEGEEEGNGKRLRAIVEYKDESWVMKAKYALEGVIYEWDPSKGQDELYGKIKQVPQDKIVATIEGTWKGKITWRRKGEKDNRMLINLDDIDPISKDVRPLSSQESMESRRIWEPVTNAILAKDFGNATKHKQDIEQRQRNTAAARKEKGEEFVPQYFHADISSGRPALTEAGRKAIEGERELQGYKDGSGLPSNEKAEGVEAKDTAQ